jgi:hypothetical protein
MPFIYSGILTLIGGMPASTLSGRKLQRDLLIKKFPKIARLPVDNNDPHPYPVKPSIFYKMRYGISHSTGIDKIYSRNLKNLFYYRVCDINNDGWLSIRKEAYSHYKSIADIINYEAIREILPDPGVKIRVNHGIMDASGMKTLLGFILWYKQYSNMVDFSG